MKPGEILRDSKTRGMFAECSKSGVVSLKLQGDLRQGPRNGKVRNPISIRMKLGEHPALSLEVARNTAARLLTSRVTEQPTLLSVT
jgi:hypothetical protein